MFVSLLQACALSQRRSAVVPKCPRISAEMSWCQSVLGPNCPDTVLTRADVSWYRNVLGPKCPVTLRTEKLYAGLSLCIVKLGIWALG